MSSERCHYDCFYNGVFGGEECCDASGFYELTKHGETCLHPDQKSMSKYIGTVSLLDLCNVLSGVPLDNSRFGENQ